MNAPSLQIRRWSNDIIVPRDCATLDRIRADLHDIAEGLPAELAAGLAPWFSNQAGEVVLVKSLAFDCELDSSGEPELLAARWACRFAKALIDAVESGGDGILRFSSPAAYRAQFIADLAGGHNGTAWYYGSFTGLAALPAAAAIRTVLLEDTACGREILASFTPEVWSRLGAVLTRRETLRILDELSAGESPDLAEPAVLTALYRECAPHLPAAPWFVTALYLYSAALRAGLDPAPGLVTWAQLAAKLPDLAARADAAALAEALLQGNMDALVAADRERDAETWVGLSARPQWRSALAEILRTEAARASEKAIHTRGDAARTAFGGLVLLLPELDDLLDETLSGALPPAEEASARDLTAWLVLAQCAGQVRATRFVGEAFWRELFGIPPEIDRARLTLWLAGVDVSPVASLLAERTVTLARGTCLPSPLRVAGQRWKVLLDQASGIWCEMSSDADFPRSDSLQTQPARQVRVAVARRARDDWRYLAMDWGLPGPWQQLFAQLAQIVLRRFAYRIPGFAGASLPYVHANFLAGSGTLDPESGRLQLARPPLHVLLNLIGMGRGTVRWSGPPERVFRLDYEP